MRGLPRSSFGAVTISARRYSFRVTSAGCTTNSTPHSCATVAVVVTCYGRFECARNSDPTTLSLKHLWWDADQLHRWCDWITVLHTPDVYSCPIAAVIDQFYLSPSRASVHHCFAAQTIGLSSASCRLSPPAKSVQSMDRAGVPGLNKAPKEEDLEKSRNMYSITISSCRQR